MFEKLNKIYPVEIIEVFSQYPLMLDKKLMYQNCNKKITIVLASFSVK
jgi:hypothetical protein